NRRDLETRHHRLLAEPASYGMDLSFFSIETHDGHSLDSIVATRTQSPGLAHRTRQMQKRLLDDGVKKDSGIRGTILLLHGRSGRKEDLLWVAQRLVAADFRCIVYDARAHGKSDGDYCTFGSKEVIDVSSLLDHFSSELSLKSKSLGPVGIFGNSLGAAVSLQALSSESRIRAAVAVAPFAELPAIAVHSTRNTIHPDFPEFLVHASLWLGGLRAGFNPYRIRPIDHVITSTQPLFIAHGTRDGVIPIDHSRRIVGASASPNLVWREVPAAYHSNVMAEGGDDLYEEIIHFYLEHLQ
ncbi:MAG: alpha/beta fold hydrolase, partial [Verrucomicrobiota bacterium]